MSDQPTPREFLQLALMAGASWTLPTVPGTTSQQAEAARYFEQAIAQSQRGEENNAIASFTKALEIAPAFQLAYYHRGDTFLSMSRYGEALGDLTEALRLEPNDEKALDTRSVVYDALGDHERAIADRTEIIRLNPDALNFCMRGIYAMGHDPDLAIADFTESIRQDPGRTDAYCFRALVFEDKGDFHLALADYRMNAQLDPQSADELADDIARVENHLSRLATYKGRSCPFACASGRGMASSLCQVEGS